MWKWKFDSFLSSSQEKEAEGERGGGEVESDYKPQALFPSDLLPLA